MRSHSSFLPSRRTLRRAERRLRRRPVLAAAALTVGALTVAGITATAPMSQAAASGSSPSYALASFATPLQSTITTAGFSGVAATDVDEALAGAHAALAGAATVTADITASGLDVGAPATVDTAKLEGAVSSLERAQLLPDAYVADFTETVATLTASVGEQVSGLRGKLDAAIAVKAEQEAAEKARVEAEAAAAAAAAEAAANESSSHSSAPNPAYATGGAVGGVSPADAQATARSMLAGYGWGDDQFGCLVALWDRESGWNYQAYNSGSGAYGIPQALPGSKMASAGADWQTNPATQIAWGLGYISGRYGNPCGAWSHSESNGWY